MITIHSTVFTINLFYQCLHSIFNYLSTFMMSRFKICKRCVIKFKDSLSVQCYNKST